MRITRIIGVPAHRLTACVVLVSLSVALSARADDAVRFDRDVMAVLSKAGCNSGRCHGNQNGKGGLQLSLRGQDPAADYDALTRQFAARRVNLLEPAASLMLLKPLAAVAHEGGRRFSPDSLEYRIVRDWIATGAAREVDASQALVDLMVEPSEAILAEPQATLQLKVTAVFADGSQRDVRDLATYEPSNLVCRVDHDGQVQRNDFGLSTVAVRYLHRQVPVRLAFIDPVSDFRWQPPAETNYIDRLNFARLEQLKINPSAPCDDATFVRRAFLDALGILPTADEARQFVEDPNPEKRVELVDRLLHRPEFAEHWALKWSDLLRNEEKVLDARGVDAFYNWIRQSFADGKPLDRFVAELVTGKGSTYDNPAANYYRANRDAVTRAETTARLFLGYRLQCAKCHNHPFDRWTQDDYYDWAAVFARVDYQIVENERQDKFDKHEFVGEQIVLWTDEGSVDNARTGKAASPRLLGESTSVAASGALESLADWLANPHNRQFARAQANWIWYHVMGRGLVEPVDDFRDTNPAIHPELLEALADDLIAGQFDLRHLVRRIMNSQTYQLSAIANDTNRADADHFSRAIVRRLTAEQLLDAQCQVLDVAADFAGHEPGLRAGQIPGVRKVRRRSEPPGSGDRFLAAFGKPERLLACECERSNETSLSQVMLLISGPGLHDRLSSQNNRLYQLAAGARTDQQVIEQLYWWALSRSPTAAELAAAAELLQQAQPFSSDTDRAWAELLNSAQLLRIDPPRLELLQDLAWALMNSKEFVFRH